jgi:hypothetical protein
MGSGSFPFSPGSMMTATGLPNWVTTAYSVVSTVKTISVSKRNAMPNPKPAITLPPLLFCVFRAMLVCSSVGSIIAEQYGDLKNLFLYRVSLRE